MIREEIAGIVEELGYDKYGCADQIHQIYLKHGYTKKQPFKSALQLILDPVLKRYRKEKENE